MVRFRMPLLATAALAVGTSFGTGSRAADWKAPDPAELALAAPVVDKDADAEALYWEIRIEDEILAFGGLRSNLWHYLRVKVFRERGTESQGKFEIPYFADDDVREIRGRTIKPDGSIVELKKDAIFDRVLVKGADLRVKAKSFAMPAVQPGCILEVRWREIRENRAAAYERIELQRDIPVQKLKLLFKPLDLPRIGMRSAAFQITLPPFADDKDGFRSVFLTSIPAYAEEPNMPPVDSVKSWLLIFYSDVATPTGPDYWKYHAKKRYAEYKPLMKATGAVESAAAEIVKGAASPEEKLRRIFDDCRSRIQNVTYSRLSEDERKTLKTNESAADTLKQRRGAAFDVNMLFGALAQASGFEVRAALLADRSDFLFSPALTSGYFLSHTAVAVKVNGSWKVFDPGAATIPFGMLRWQQEGQRALLADPEDAVWVPTPATPADRSLHRKTARLALTPDGALEGDVISEGTGHIGAIDRARRNDPVDKQQQDLVDSVHRRLPSAEISQVSFENASDPEKPFVTRYHVKVPDYAVRTGKRLVLQPNYWATGRKPRFPASQRQNPVYFDFPWSEQETLTIELPPGVVVDAAASPEPITVVNLGAYQAKVQPAPDGRSLSYDRSFSFTASLIPAGSYPALKNVFDRVQAADGIQTTLRPEEPGRK